MRIIKHTDCFDDEAVLYVNDDDGGSAALSVTASFRTSTVHFDTREELIKFLTDAARAVNEIGRTNA